MTVVIGIALLAVLGVVGGVALWVWWPTLQASRERQRIEYETRQGQWRAQQITYEAMDRLLREARQPMPRVTVTQETFPADNPPQAEGDQP